MCAQSLDNVVQDSKPASGPAPNSRDALASSRYNPVGRRRSGRASPSDAIESARCARSSSGLHSSPTPAIDGGAGLNAVYGFAEHLHASPSPMSQSQSASSAAGSPASIPTRPTSVSPSAALFSDDSLSDDEATTTRCGIHAATDCAMTRLCRVGHAEWSLQGS
jgi:hypothetical protein